MLRTENVVKIYDPKRPEVKALAGISLNFPEKGMVFVVGKSGSGKSTLMNILGVRTRRVLAKFISTEEPLPL